MSSQRSSGFARNSARSAQSQRSFVPRTNFSRKGTSDFSLQRSKSVPRRQINQRTPSTQTPAFQEIQQSYPLVVRLVDRFASDTTIRARGIQWLTEQMCRIYEAREAFESQPDQDPQRREILTPFPQFVYHFLSRRNRSRPQTQRLLAEITVTAHSLAPTYTYVQTFCRFLSGECETETLSFYLYARRAVLSRAETDETLPAAAFFTSSEDGEPVLIPSRVSVRPGAQMRETAVAVFAGEALAAVFIKELAGDRDLLQKLQLPRLIAPNPLSSGAFKPVPMPIFLKIAIRVFEGTGPTAEPLPVPDERPARVEEPPSALACAPEPQPGTQLEPYSPPPAASSTAMKLASFFEKSAAAKTEPSPMPVPRSPIPPPSTKPFPTQPVPAAPPPQLFAPATAAQGAEEGPIPARSPSLHAALASSISDLSDTYSNLLVSPAYGKAPPAVCAQLRSSVLAELEASLDSLCAVMLRPAQAHVGPIAVALLKAPDTLRSLRAALLKLVHEHQHMTSSDISFATAGFTKQLFGCQVLRSHVEAYALEHLRRALSGAPVTD
eukprot:gnl/Chilomastix_cuspidata/1461.p2 GENE.gnl/Chilomastix_cuspidata/1461~~gnl/Chilomastix_cuspidata/1461.p2  ORF type:complete len:584 (-),score=216.69 gnl/Chilomastix_cuspidata/1461:2277-3932(-)